MLDHIIYNLMLLNSVINLYNHNIMPPQKIIGVYAPPISQTSDSEFKTHNEDYVWITPIHLQEIKMLNSNNIKTVILPYNLSPDAYDDYLEKLDAIYVCGSPVLESFEGISTKEFSRHQKTLKVLLTKITHINKHRSFPILAVCHGYELLIKIIENLPYTSTFLDTDYSINYGMYNVKFINEQNKYEVKNKMLLDFRIALTLKKFRKTKHLQKHYTIISVGEDNNKKPFVDFIKHKTLPFYLTKSHPLTDNKKIFREFINCIDDSDIKDIKLPYFKYRTYSITKFLNFPKMRPDNKIRVYNISE